MEIPATVTSKGQITIPARIREALGISVGDTLVFRVDDGGHVTMRPRSGSREVDVEKVPDFFDLAGSVPTSPHVDPEDWRSQREAAWEASTVGSEVHRP